MPFITQGPEGEQAPYRARKTNWKFLLIVIVLAVIVGAGALWYSMKQKVLPVKLSELQKQTGENETIAFIQDGGIWVSSKDLKNQYKAIDTKEDIIDFAFSADGKEIYWLNGREIWKRDSNGDLKLLIKASEFNIEEFKKKYKDADWISQEDIEKFKGGIKSFQLSPDGKFIAYQEIEDYTGCCGGGLDIPVTWIWIIKNDGTEKIKIDEPLGVWDYFLRFEWFPDSKRILFVFSNQYGGGPPFFEVGIDGKNPKIYNAMYQEPYPEANYEWGVAGASPVFSSTDDKMAYVEEGYFGEGKVWLANIDGTEKKLLLQKDEAMYVREILKWSEDGSLLTVMADKLYVFNKKGDIVLETDPINDSILSFDNNNLSVLTGEAGDPKILYMNIFNKEKKEFQLPKNVSQVKIVNYQFGKEQPDETADWKTYRNEQYGFEIKYPSTMNFKEKQGGLFGIEIPELMNLWLKVEKKPENFSNLENYLTNVAKEENDSCKIELGEYDSAYCICDIQSQNFGDKKTFELIHHATQGNGGAMGGTGVDVYFEKDDYFVIVYYSYYSIFLDGSQKLQGAVEQYNTIQQMLSTFKFIDKFCGTSTNGSCVSDSDCIAGGCSGQLCQSKNDELLGTTCEWKECYREEDYGLECGCVNKKCQWAE